MQKSHGHIQFDKLYDKVILQLPDCMGFVSVALAIWQWDTDININKKDSTVHMSRRRRLRAIMYMHQRS